MTNWAVPLSREAQINQELRWRIEARANFVTYGRTVPVPGVPQSDNLERLMDEDLVGRKFDDGRFDHGQILIPQIETDFAQHHLLTMDTCQRLVEGNLMAPDGSTCRHVLIMMPPGSAKSTIGSVLLPTWDMGRNEDHLIITTSYGDILAKKHGRRARQVCLSPEYRSIFDTSISDKTKAANQWALMNGSEYMARGLQSGLTGNRCNGLIWDDPIRGRRAAESPVEQQSTWEAYRDDARTRKIPTAWELGILTRWHENDLAGKILPESWAGQSGYIKCRDGNWWYVLCLQAQVEVEGDPLGRKIGEYLWPEWFQIGGVPDAYWAPFKLDSRSWGSLYQQVPTPPEGDFFKQSWVNRYEHAPRREDLRTYISADYAVTTPEDLSDPDWSVIGVWGVDRERKVYLLDGWKGRVDTSQWIDRLLDLAEDWKPMAHISGKGQIRRSVEPFLRERMIKRGVFFRTEWLEETYGKEVNARSFQAMMACGQVWWPYTEFAEWIIRHLTGFGTLTHDDPVDMCSFLGRYLHRLWTTKAERQAIAPPVIEGGKISIASLGAKKLKIS